MKRKKMAAGRGGQIPGPKSSPSDRVAWLVQTHFGGNRSAASRAINVSHTLINEVVAGRQAPGRKLLMAIAGKLDVNTAWLLTGHGKPLLTKSEDRSAEYAVPISRVLLPGPPAEHPELLTGNTRGVSHFLHRPTRYFVNTVAIATEQIKVGDLILVEADPRACHQDVNRFLGKLCVVRQQDTCQLIRMNSKAPVAVGVSKPMQRSIEPGEEPFTAPSPTHQFDEIVGVAIELHREL